MVSPMRAAEALTVSRATCIVHLIRKSLAFVSWKNREKVMPDLRAIYRKEISDWESIGNLQESNVSAMAV